MKREIYTGEFDEFEVPSQIWENVEAHLNKNEKKKRAFIWLKIAGVLALILTIGGFLTANLLGDDQKLIASNETVKQAPDERKEDAKQVNQDQIKGDPVDEEVLPVYPPDMMEINSLSTNVPFLQISPDAYAGSMGITYNWSAGPVTIASGTAINLTGAPSASYTIRSGNYDQNLTPLVDQNQLIFTSARDQSRNDHLTKGFINLGNISEDLYFANRDGDGRWSDPEIYNGSHYDEFVENDFLKSKEAPLSTFSIDVDGASYSDVRGMINRGERPNPNSIRIEEFVNYFPYSYDEPAGEHPFSMHSEVGACPWNTEHKLMKIGIKGKSIEKAQLPVNNLVFLLDVSGSMDSPEKLELLKKGFRLLVKELREEDRVSICVYAGAAGLVLPPTSGANKDKIMDALNNLSAGGSTAGGEGIELAYATATENFKKTGNNRVILATDGDFNVGLSDDNALVKLIEEKRESGVFLTVLGFGHDNFQSSKMEKLANNGNGNFSFIDNILEAKKVLVTEMGATLQTIAKDVKIQVEFNPEFVAAYRLIGYENRLLQNEDFSNDTIDAGELGAGHTVTALYEIIPANASSDDKAANEDELKYSQVSYESNGQFKDELATMKFRYKVPTGTESILIEQTVPQQTENPSDDFKFIQSVVEFGMILRDSKFAGTSNFDDVLKRAQEAKGADPYGYRTEFILLVEKAKLLEIVN